MATYNWYFSMSGGGNVFSQTSPGRWLSSHQVGYIKGETTAQDKIDSVNVNDTVNLFFKRGDTWSMDTAKVSKTIIYGLLIDTNSPIVHINAYASGNKPIFDGLVSNFSVAPVHNSTTGPLFYNQLFQFKRNNCSISNIEIKRVYGHGIILSNGNYFTLDSSYIHHFGAGGVSISSSTGGNNITVTKNVFHTGQELYHYGLRSGWEAAIQLTAQDYIVEDNIIQYNVVYDIYGEGIQCPNSLCEYNIVGDTGSIALNTSNHGWDAKTTIVRYNIVTMSDWDSNIYDSLNGSSPIGIRVFDEHIGGDNSNADIQIYGNIIINAKYGIKLGSPVDRGNPYGFVKIYNNTMIDCEANWCFSQPEEFSNVYIYNNSSIHYNKACAHIINWDISEGYNGWNISHNHFYPVDNINTVLPIFTNNYLTMNPKLIGGDIVDWTGQSGPTYFKDIKFSDLYPMADSPLIGSGKPLGIGFDNIFLTKGSDFSTLPNVPKFILAMQPEVGNWDIGAIITSGINLCAGVVCDNICIGNDLWSQKCVNGACFLDQMIQQNSSTCGYDPCDGVVCDNICQGNDLWSQKCVNGACFLDQLVEQNSSTCGYDPCAGVVCDNICQGNDLWSQKCVNGACFLDQMIQQNSVTCDLSLCENVFCHNTCVGYDLWSQICDPETGVCKVDQLLESNSATCMVTDYIPTDESTIKLYLVMGGLAFAGLGMVMLAKNK